MGRPGVSPGPVIGTYSRLYINTIDYVIVRLYYFGKKNQARDNKHYRASGRGGAFKSGKIFPYFLYVHIIYRIPDEKINERLYFKKIQYKMY
jgi:hypothetical protein